MPTELTREAEDLLVALASADGALASARDRLDRRQMAIAEPLMKGSGNASPAEKRAAAEKLNQLRRTTYRSELAALSAEIVNAERRRARILAKLDAFDLGDGPGNLTPRGFNLRGTFSPSETYAQLDVVALDGGSFAARRDNPGPCPGPGWMLLAQRGKAGRPGDR